MSPESPKDVLADVYRAKAFAMLPRSLQDRVVAILREPPPKECSNCGAVGSHTEACVHHPDVQARLRESAR